MFFRGLPRSLLAVLFAISGKAQFEIRGSRLFLDSSPFTVQGVAYSPTPIGETAGPVLRLSGCVYDRDFPLAARAGVNTVRVYGRLPAAEPAFWKALETSNLYLLADFPLDPYHDEAATLAAGPLRPRIIEDFVEYARQLRDQRRVIALVFGNDVIEDYRRKFAGSPGDFYRLAEEAAAAMRAALGSRAPLLTTAVAAPSQINDPELPGLSFWSVNTQPGTGFGALFEDLRRRTGKPVLLSEFGHGAWDLLRQAEDAATQAVSLRNLVGSIRQETARPGSSLIGGVWLEWSDEWWRGGPDLSRPGARPAARLGLFEVTATAHPGLDSLRPRPAFAALAEEWGGQLPRPWPPSKGPRLDPRGAVNAGSLAPPVAPGGLVSLFGQDLAIPGGRELTSVCIGSLAAPLLYVDPSQVNAQLPWETPPATVAALLYRGGEASNVVAAEVRPVAPGILDRGVLEAGKPCPVTVSNGVRRGAYLEVYGTGLGAALGPAATGVPAVAPRPVDVAPRMFLGPRELRVLYSGLVPGALGLYQTNTQVPEEAPASAGAGLRLLAGGLESNAYPISVLPDGAVPRLWLEPEALDFVVQAGGPPQSVEVAIEGRNGFCELVRFRAAGLPEGISVGAPVGWPGQRIPVAVQAALQTAGSQPRMAALLALSPALENPSLTLRITVLPSQGDIAFRVTSGGARAGLVARFEMAGRLLHEARGGGPGRGFHFLTLDGSTGVLGRIRSFDTWLEETASEAMIDYLAALPAGTLVLGAIADEGTLRLTARARAALRQLLRSRLIEDLRYQDSWAIMARLGATAPIAEAAASTSQVVLDRVLTFPIP